MRVWLLRGITTLLLFAPTQARSEAVLFGLALYDSVAVYADSAGVGEQLAALGLADDVLVLGKTWSEAYSDSMYVWCRVELNDGRQGWVKREDIALTYYVVEVKEDSVIVRTQPDVVGDSIREVFKGDFITVYERVSAESQNWLSVKFYRGTIVKGWMPERVANPHPEGAVVELVWSYLGGYGLFVGENRPSKDLDKALLVVERLKERDAEYIYLIVEGDDDVAVDLKAEAQWLKHWVLRKMGRFDDAMDALREIVARYPEQDLASGRADGVASFEIAEIYRVDIGDTSRAIEAYHGVIINYPNFPIGGSEWNDWIDIRAARRIIDLLKESGDADQLLVESQRILEENDNDAVALLGYLGIATAFRMQGRDGAEIEKVISEGLAKVLEAYGTYSKNGGDYAITLLGYGIETYMDAGDFRSALRLCSKIEDSYTGLQVGSYAQLSIAEIMDSTIGDLDEVIETYQKVAMGTTDFIGWDPIKGRGYWRGAAQRRLETLQEVIPETVVVEDENVWMRVTGKESAEVVKVLSKGEALTLFYGDSGLSRDGDLEGFWQKVKTGDGRVGWVLDAHLERNIEPIFNRGAAISVWSMLGGGPRHAPVFSGEKMERPQVIRQISNVYAREILFWDVNGD
ncbi:MAG: tetratricopeptide repeat protein, partial [Candidatus Latescibacterota bacterium]